MRYEAPTEPVSASGGCMHQPATCSTRSTRSTRMQDANHSICSSDPDHQDAGCQPPHLLQDPRILRMQDVATMLGLSPQWVLSSGTHCYARAPRRTQTPTLGLQDPGQDPRSRGLHLGSRGLQTLIQSRYYEQQCLGSGSRGALNSWISRS